MNLNSTMMAGLPHQDNRWVVQIGSVMLMEVAWLISVLCRHFFIFTYSAHAMIEGKGIVLDVDGWFLHFSMLTMVKGFAYEVYEVRDFAIREIIYNF